MLSSDNFNFLQTLILLICFANVSMSISQEVFTAKEKQALERFRPLVNGILTHDYQREDEYLIRWLRVKKLDVDLAVKAFQEAQQWRNDNKMDSIVNETILEFSSPPYSLDGVDKNGRPVLIWSTTNIDIRKLILGGKRDKVRRYLLQSSERAVLKSRETTKDSRFVSIIDLNGFSLRQHGCLACIEVYVDWTRQTEKNYPGVYAYDLWINTPRIALPIIEVLRPLMAEEYAKGFRAFGTNREEWSAFLRKIIPADQLTFQLGGTKKS